MQSEYVTETFHTLSWYLAGPMSGIPQGNFPKFDRIAAELRAAGYIIKSPAELDDPAIREKVMKDEPITDLTWGDFLSRDIKVVADECDGVIVMDGWEKSRGARLEVFVANLCGHSIYVYEGKGRIRSMGEGEYLRGLTQATVIMGGSDYGRRKQA